MDEVQAWSTLAAATIAGLGLIGLVGGYLSLRNSLRANRIQWAPYLRVDVGSRDGEETDFVPPTSYYRHDANVLDLNPELNWGQKVTYSAWFTNYQNHKLGFALTVECAFLVALDYGGRVSLYEKSVAIAYVEQGKSVEVELFRIPRESDAILSVVSLSFYDLYDNRLEHSEWEKGSNALHGRISCGFSNGKFVSTPEAWAKGPKVGSAGLWRLAQWLVSKSRRAIFK